MTETKWTKGPWRIVGEDSTDADGYLPFIDIEAANGRGGYRPVCEVSPSFIDDDFVLTKKDWATAHLIASAPDLYEALHNATASLEGFLEGEENHPIQEHIDTANAALAKARGES